MYVAIERNEDGGFDVITPAFDTRELVFEEIVGYGLCPGDVEIVSERRGREAQEASAMPRWTWSS